MQDHRIRRASSGDHALSLNLDGGEFARQLENEQVDALVGVERLLSRGIDVGYRHRVGTCKRTAELVREVQRPRVEVRLEQDQHTALCKLARSGERRRDLRRMVRVIVVDEDTARLTAELEAPCGPRVLGEVSLCLTPIDPHELERSEDRKSVV